MPWPNFFLVGAAKAGTTSLYHYLRQHPDIYMSPVKEPQYYGPDVGLRPAPPPRSQAQYLALFAAAEGQRAIGEASPQYLHVAGAAERIAYDVPQARIIVSLREPAQRAWSSYLGRLRGGRERQSPERALQSDSYYVRTSLYSDDLRRYFALFTRERVRVLLYDDLGADRAATMRALFAFLQVDPGFRPALERRHNPGLMPRIRWLNQWFNDAFIGVHALIPERFHGSGIAAWTQRWLLLRPAPPMPAELRRRMLPWFRDDVARTAHLIGRDLSHWLD